jgi:hypothetical protein
MNKTLGELRLMTRRQILPGAQDHPQPLLDQSGHHTRQCLLASDLLLHH